MSTYRFGEFELDLDAQQLRLRGQPVPLERRPLDLLILLVRQQGRMVPRDEIVAALWPPKVIIDFDSGLNTLVRKIRKALGDSSETPMFIETVPGRGYRFIAPVTASTPVDSEPAAPVKTKSMHWSRPVVAVTVTLLVAAAIYVWQSLSTGPDQTRIAVLPFENLTGNEDLDYLASGIAEETNLSLSQIDLPNLSVIGVVSTRAVANSAAPLQQARRELGADLVVASSLRQDRSRIRVTSRLIRVADSEQIWSASFDRELTNVLGLQRELSIAIAEQIRQRLSPSVAAEIDRRQTRNPAAYELYLKGRYEWTRFQPDSIERALQYYEQAVAIDPGYALAWAGIAHALVTSPATVGADRRSVVPEAREALQRALEFGPDLAETQLALGSFHLFIDMDLLAAETAARRAVTLDANSAMSHMFLGIALAEQRKHVEARAMLRRARELDPLFPLMFANSAHVAVLAGERRDALEFATQAIAINPEFWPGYFHLGNAHLALGDYEAALEAFSSAERLSGGNSARSAATRAYILAMLGREDEARDVLAALTSQSSGRFVSPYNFAIVHAGLGEVDSAFEWLERGMAVNDYVCMSLPGDRRFDNLRSDLRFESLMNRCSQALDAPSPD